MFTNTLAVRRELAFLISAKKGVRVSKLNHTDFSHLGFDELDLVDIILEVERKFNVVIPDELPLRNLGDFVQFISSPALRQAS
jgi:acyl carrier protein